MEAKQFEILTSKLDKIIRLLGANAVQGRNVEQSILYLNSLGFQPAEIALILGRSGNQVSVTLSQYKKKKVEGKATETNLSQKEPESVNVES